MYWRAISPDWRKIFAIRSIKFYSIFFQGDNGTVPFRGDRNVVAGTVTNIFFLVKMTAIYVVYFKGVQIAERGGFCFNSIPVVYQVQIASQCGPSSQSPTSTWNTDVAMRASNVDNSETHR